MRETISRFDYIDAARSLGQQFAGLVRDVDSPDARLHTRAGWSLADCVGHVACEPSRYLAMAHGDDEWPCRPSDLTDIFAKQIANLPTRDTRLLADKFLVDLDHLLTEVTHYGARVPMMRISGQYRVRADAALGILIGELAIRGRDIARALGAPWTIEPHIAPLVTRGGHQLLAPWSEGNVCGDHSATYEIRIRQTGERIIYEFTEGRLRINPAEHRRPDVYTSIDPACAVLAAHGRLSPTWAILTGRAFAWGARPWLATGLGQRLAVARQSAAQR